MAAPGCLMVHVQYFIDRIYLPSLLLTKEGKEEAEIAWIV